MSDAAVAKTATLILQAARQQSGPLVVAIDGPSGTGKSTLARALGERLSATVIEGEDFYAGGVGILGDSSASRAACCIYWQAQRRVLAAVRVGQEASYHALDWDAFDGSLRAEPTRVDPARLLILEGVYSARPELRALIDFTIMGAVPDTLRQARLIAREGEIGPWERQWHEAEDWYFAQSSPPSAFDLVLDLG